MDEESMTGRILIVDDVATNRIVMKVKLAQACYSVEQADSGAVALRTARENRPDLIILDVLMPDMSGLEVCRRIKADPETADIPVLLVTTLSDRASKMAGLEAGADDFLTKPVDEVTLLARVRSLIRARDTVRELRSGANTAQGTASRNPWPGSKPGATRAASGWSPPARPARFLEDPRSSTRWAARCASCRAKPR
jgi:two-component system cell cycle response regulator